MFSLDLRDHLLLAVFASQCVVRPPLPRGCQAMKGRDSHIFIIIIFEPFQLY